MSKQQKLISSKTDAEGIGDASQINPQLLEAQIEQIGNRLGPAVSPTGELTEEAILATPLSADCKASNFSSPNVAVTDALAKWDAEMPLVQCSLTEIRLDANDTILVPFTADIGEVDLHFVHYKSLHGYVRCNRDGCLLCHIGRTVEKRDLLPIFSPVDQRVGVLAISLNIRPDALRPQILPVLRRLKGNQRELVIINHPDRFRYIVTAQPLAEDLDDGATQIAAFLRDFDAGLVDLASVFTAVSNDELSRVPEVAISLKARGIQA